MAKALAKEEGLQVNLSKQGNMVKQGQVWTLLPHCPSPIQGQAFVAVELAALLHDVQDWKYAGKDQESFKVQDFLDQQQLDVSLKELVLRIIAGIGFKVRLHTKRERNQNSKMATPSKACMQNCRPKSAAGSRHPSPSWLLSRMLTGVHLCTHPEQIPILQSSISSWQA